MDPDKDWIRLHRGLMLNDLWTKEVFSPGQAWVDLLMVANWKDNRALVKGAIVPVMRGQLCRSMKQLSIRWGWSVGKVKRFLETCSELGQLSFEIWPKNGTAHGTVKSAITTLITITNYDKYQYDGTASGTQAERWRNGGGTVTETEEEGKKERKKEKPESSLPDGFNDICRKARTAIGKIQLSSSDMETIKGWSDFAPEEIDSACTITNERKGKSVSYIDRVLREEHDKAKTAFVNPPCQDDLPEWMEQAIRETYASGK